MNRSKFLQAFSLVRRELTAFLVHGMNATDMDKCAKRIDSLLTYNVNGKCQRGLLLIESYCQLQQPPLSDSQFYRAVRLALTLELLQGFFLVLDDIVDGGEMRRGKPCWHKLPGIGISAVNDALLLNTAIDSIIAHSFGSTHLFEPITGAFRQARHVTLSGQMMDAVTVDWTDCTMERYRDICQRKTSHYTFFSPVQLALLLADCHSALTSIQKLCYDLGFYFQAQDDYLDCFGDYTVTGKIGTDLRETKCTWVTATAREITANDARFSGKFQKYFGRGCEESVKQLKMMLEQIELPKLYATFEAEQRLKLIDQINSIPVAPLKQVFHSQLQSLYQRQK